MQPAGVGLGLRSPHFADVIDGQPDLPWFEALADNYLALDSAPARRLAQVRRDYPITFHCVGASLGSVEPLDAAYFDRVRRAADFFEPAWISDHLCFTGAAGLQTHELLPLPYTDEAIAHCAGRLAQIQDLLGQRILIENVSSYVVWSASCMSEAEFLAAVAERADCDILLDINNIHVSAENHGFDADAYMTQVPPERVRELHLAGHEDCGSHLLDTHGEAVQEPVWALYERALQRFGPVPTLIEWDNNIPPFPVLLEQTGRAQQIMTAVQRAG